MKTNPVLFLKTFNAEQPVYERILRCPQHNDLLDNSLHSAASVSFRSLSLPKDISLLHGWVSHPGAERFWQLKGYTGQMLLELYTELLSLLGYHSLIGQYNGKAVCQVDVYHIHASELKPFVPGASRRDCGLHFLMAPPRESFKGLSLLMLRAFMDAYFTYPFAGDLYAEPDELNALANRLAMKAGFRLLRKASLPHKMANVYRITKQEFLAGLTLIS